MEALYGYTKNYALFLSCQCVEFLNHVLFFLFIDSKYSVLPYGELYIHDVDSVDGHQGYRCRTIHKLTKEQRSSATEGKVVVTGEIHKIIIGMDLCVKYACLFADDVTVQYQ